MFSLYVDEISSVSRKETRLAPCYRCITSVRENTTTPPGRNTCARRDVSLPDEQTPHILGFIKKASQRCLFTHLSELCYVLNNEKRRMYDADNRSTAFSRSERA